MNFPILSTLIFLPLISSFFIFLSKGQKNNYSAIYISLFSSLATFILSIFIWYSMDFSSSEFQFLEEQSWINNFIKFKLGVDGISILFIVLTTLITPICIVSCINSVKDRIKEFLIAILVLETFMIGVFCSLDLVVFYLFFEAGLIPMFLIIGVWGGPRRVYSAFKFFLFTLLGSVLMLAAIIAIYWITGTTDVTQIYEVKIPKEYQNLLWLAFFSSFAVKMPMWPVHTWLPDAHVEAPTAGSVILAAILLKMAGYGFLRFSVPMFPLASEYFTPLIYTLSIIAIIYTSLVALMQEDMKKLIAYSSVAHMGYVTLGIFTFTKQGIEGSIYQMISHGLISAALFLCVGVVYDRLHSRMISTYGGIVNYLPKYSFLFIVFALAGLGLPGTSGFLGEFLVLTGAFQKSYLVAMLATFGVVLGAAYMLWLTKRVIFGVTNNEEVKKMHDVNKTEILMLGILTFLVIVFGNGGSAAISSHVAVDISKNLKLFLREQKPKHHWHIGIGMVGDPFQSLTKIVEVDPVPFLKKWVGEIPTKHTKDTKSNNGYLSQLTQIQKDCYQNFNSILEESDFNYFSAVKKVVDQIPGNSVLHLGNSMPVRIANFIGINDSSIDVWCNRGTSGIDGVLSTAVGHALGSPDRKHTLIIGDLSFFYDRNGLWLNHAFPSNLQIVILNDSGGGIFNMIPGPSNQEGLIDLFTTPHNSTAKLTAEEFGLDYRTAISLEAIDGWKAGILEIFTDMKTNTKTFKRIATKAPRLKENFKKSL